MKKKSTRRSEPALRRRESRRRTRRASGAKNSARGGAEGEASRPVGDANSVHRDPDIVGRTVAQQTLRLAYDIGALISLAGKNLMNRTAALASGYVRSAEMLANSLVDTPRKPGALALSRPSAVEQAAKQVTVVRSQARASVAADTRAPRAR